MARRHTFNRRRAEQQSAFITVREAAQQLGIGEGLAYRMANEYLATRGASGLPCVRGEIAQCPRRRATASAPHKASEAVFAARMRPRAVPW
jgi:hypothetical protein